MGELLNIWTKVGAIGFFLIFIAYVVLKHIVPHWKDRDNKEQEFKRKQTERIQDREDGILQEVGGLIRQNIAQSEKMTDRMDALTEEIRQDIRQRRR